MSKVTLRWANSNDSESIAKIYEPIVRDTPISFEIEVPSSKTISERIEKIGADNPYLVALVDHKVVGYAYSVDFRTRKAYRFTKEATVYVDENSRKQGVASLLYEKLFEILKTQGVVKIIAVITIPNDRSVVFHKKMGFRLSGTITDSGYKFSRFWDVCFYEKTIDENLIELPELKNWNTVRAEFPELVG